MRRVISASRRTDLVAFFPVWLDGVVEDEKARVYGPSGRVYTVDLSPENVHTFVLWSKNFENFVKNKHGLRESLEKYDQLYFHFTITGLGGSFIEREVPRPEAAMAQLEALVEAAGRPERISLRFDPVVYWKERGEPKTNLDFFEELAPRAGRLGIRNIRTSFAQWYGKSKRRAARHGFSYVDPPWQEKKKAASRLVEIARGHGLNLFACSQDVLTEVPGISPSSCIDGRLLRDLHPSGEPALLGKDKTQRAECRCTQSVDIGSYRQSCPHSCLYCYANPN